MPKRIIFPEKDKVSFEDFELPEIRPGQVRVRTYYSLMSIGTETIILGRKYDTDTHFARIFSFPQLKTGVQALGQVEQVAHGVEEFRAGDVIYMRQAHGSHQVLPASACSPVPSGIDLKSACWAGLAKTAFRAAWAGRFGPGKHILVIGAGPVGQMALRWASAAGVQTIAVADLSGNRLEHAERGGATLTFEGSIADCMDRIQALDEGNGPSIVVDATGNPAVFQPALAAAGKYARVILLGDTGYPSRQCLSSEAMTKGLTIQATHDSHDRDGWTQRRIDGLFFDLVKRDKFNLSGLITHEFSPQDCREAYALASDHRHDAMGILYDWTKSDW